MIPAIHTFRLESLITKRTWYRTSQLSVHTSTFHREEICSAKNIPVSPEKLSPGGLPLSLRTRFHSRFLQNRSNRSSTDLVPEIGQCSLDSRVAPGAILLCHFDHKRSQFFSGWWAADYPPIASAVILLGDEPPVPGKKRLWCNNIGDFL